MEGQKKKFVCGVCGVSLNYSSSLGVHMKMHTGQDFKCSIFPKTFWTKSNLKSHEISHSESRPFKCDICSLRFKRKQLHRIHLEEHANEGKPFECSICKTRFKLKRGLAKHVKYLHSKQYGKKFQCIFCNKSFISYEHLEIHLRQKIQERPFFCTLCPWEFKQFPSLKMHLARHDPNRARRFECELCPRRFFTGYELRTHLGAHTREMPFRCDICRKEFRIKKSLKSHLRSAHNSILN